MGLGNSAVTPSTAWSRCALVWGAATVATALLVTVLVPSLAEGAAALRVGARTTASFDAVLVWCCAAVAAGDVGVALGDHHAGSAGRRARPRSRPPRACPPRSAG